MDDQCENGCCVEEKWLGDWALDYIVMIFVYIILYYTMIYPFSSMFMLSWTCTGLSWTWTDSPVQGSGNFWTERKVRLSVLKICAWTRLNRTSASLIPGAQDAQTCLKPHSCLLPFYSPSCCGCCCLLPFPLFCHHSVFNTSHSLSVNKNQ